MATIKMPRSLRDTAQADRLSGRVWAGMGMVAAFCMSAADQGTAQTADQRTLPTLTVDAPAEPTPKPRRRAPQRQTPVPPPQPSETAAPIEPVPAEPSGPGAGQTQDRTTEAATGQSGQGAGQTGQPGVALDANPYANPAAPYLVERSASVKLTEPLADTPRTIVVIPKEVLRDKGATSIRDLVRTMPGMTLGTGEGGNAFGDRVFIRGFDARNDMYINGIRDSGVTTRETFMAEQVEVLEGPAGVISGRGTTGGAINVVTKQPLADNFYNISVTGGTDATARVTADINQNLSDKFAFRVNGLFQNAQVSERDYVYDDRYGISLAGLWKPTDDVRVYADYYFVYFDQLPDWGVPFDPRVRRPFTETGVDRSNYYGVVSRDFQHNYQHMGTAGVEWNVKPWLTLNNKFRYSYTVTDYVAAKPGTPNLTNPDWTQWTVASTPASRYQVNQTIADQMDATFTFYTMGWKHSLVTGIEFAREEISQDSYSNLAIECFPNCTSAAATGINYSLFWPASNSIVTATSPTRNGRPTVTAVNTFSAYVLDTMNLNDRLFINIGGRFDNYDITKTPFGAASVARTDPLFNWNAGLLYKIIPNLGAYIAYSTSSNPVGSELDASSDAYGGLAANNQVFAPERNTALEVGLKWELFEKRMLLTTALFQTTKDNARETVGTGATATLDDTAAYRIRGLQLGVAGNITDRWSVFGGAVFMNSAMTESAVAGSVGLPLANIAHQSFNLLTKYRLTDDLTIGGQATYKSEIYGGTLAAVNYAPGTVNVGGVSTATPGGYNTLPSGWRIDLLADYRINDRFTASLRVLNLFNARLYDAFYRSNTPYVYIAPGRAAYLTIRGSF